MTHEEITYTIKQEIGKPKTQEEKDVDKCEHSHVLM